MADSPVESSGPGCLKDPSNMGCFYGGSVHQMDVNEWLVVVPLWKMMNLKSVGMLFHSQYDGKVIIQPCSSHHQPDEWFSSKPCLIALLRPCHRPRIWAPPTVHQIALPTVGPHLQETMVLMAKSVTMNEHWWWNMIKSIKSPSRADDIASLDNFGLHRGSKRQIYVDESAFWWFQMCVNMMCKSPTQHD